MTDAAATPNVPPSCAALAAQLIVEGCLPIIQGTVKGKTPIEPVVLLDEEREKVGARGQITLFYPAGEDGVFFDAGDNEFTIWFTGGDSDRATNTLHDALLRAFPSAVQLDDVPDQWNARLRARVYRVDLGSGLSAAISTSFTSLAQDKVKFAAHIIAQQRKA